MMPKTIFWIIAMLLLVLIMPFVNALQPGLPSKSSVLFSCNMNAGDINGATLNCSLGGGSSYNGDIKGNPTSVAGLIGEALRFDGTGDWVTINRTSAMNSALDNNFSIGVCGSYTTTTANLRMWGIRDTTSGDNECLINRPGTGRIRCDAGESDISSVSSSNANLNKGGFFNLFVVVNDTGTRKLQMFINGTSEDGPTAITDFVEAADDKFTIGATQEGAAPFIGDIDQFYFFNVSLGGDQIAAMNTSTNGVCTPFSDLGEGEATPPEINQNSYNMTSEGGAGCINWRTDKTDACVTGDTTPTVKFNTNKVAFCAIGISNLNYTDMGASRNCAGGEGELAHTCTLTAQDTLSEGTADIYLSCKDINGNQNRTSTSNALRITVSNDENLKRNSIEAGAQSALSSGYTIYTGQRIYARNSANTQAIGIFDKVIKWMDKIWAFNTLNGADQAATMFNITPVLYVLDLNDTNASKVESNVNQFILNTK